MLIATLTLASAPAIFTLQGAPAGTFWKLTVNTFVFASSAACYGEVEDGICRVTDKNEPTNPYGYSKRMTEVMLNDFARAYGMNSVSLRFFNVAGAEDKLRTGLISKSSTNLIKVNIASPRTGSITSVTHFHIKKIK